MTLPTDDGIARPMLQDEFSKFASRRGFDDAAPLPPARELPPVTAGGITIQKAPPASARTFCSANSESLVFPR